MDRLTSALVLSITAILLATGCTAPIAPSALLPVFPEAIGQPVIPDLVIGTPLSYDLTAMDRYDYVGEPYESDYCTACRRYWLTTPATNDVRVELVWSGSTRLQLWATDGYGNVKTAALNGGLGAAFLVVQGGTKVQVTVGTPSPTAAPTTAIHFTLSATAISPDAR